MKCKSYYHFFEVIANKTRFKIIEYLIKGPQSVGEICSGINEEQSKISHNLRVLSGCNIVDVKKEGKNRIYSLNKETVEPMLILVHKHVQTHCNGRCGLE